LLTQAGLTAIEELGSGAVFCQLLLKAHPKAIQQHRINYQATTTYEFTNNFRLLQNTFAELGIERPLDVEALARAQYRDNFELAVWFYWYIDGQQP
jgi:RP/EB family microtubule-associated protein